MEARTAGWVVAVVLVCAGACREAPADPESEVRRTLAEIVDAARMRDLGFLKEHVSQGYQDSQGHDARGVRGLLALHVLRRRDIHVLSNVKSVDFPEPGQARVEATAAFAGRPISPERLLDVRASLYRFELELAKEEDGAWRVRRADWRPIGPKQFL